MRPYPHSPISAPLHCGCVATSPLGDTCDIDSVATGAEAQHDDKIGDTNE